MSEFSAVFWKSAGFPTKEFAIYYLGLDESFSDKVYELSLETGKLQRTHAKLIREFVKKDQARFDRAQRDFSARRQQLKLAKEQAREPPKAPPEPAEVPQNDYKNHWEVSPPSSDLQGLISDLLPYSSMPVVGKLVPLLSDYLIGRGNISSIVSVLS